MPTKQLGLRGIKFYWIETGGERVEKTNRFIINTSTNGRFTGSLRWF